jgi:hypothetical protein
LADFELLEEGFDLMEGGDGLLDGFVIEGAVGEDTVSQPHGIALLLEPLELAGPPGLGNDHTNRIGSRVDGGERDSGAESRVGYASHLRSSAREGL